MARIVKVAHVVLGVRNPKESARFYKEVLGMEEVNSFDYGEGDQVVFLTFGEHDHDIALVKISPDQPVGNSGDSHTALQIEGGLDELRQLYQHMKDHGAEIEFAADHVFANSFYIRDPDGNRLEIYTQVMEHEESKRVLGESSDLMDFLKPLELDAKTASYSTYTRT
jgi:catechol-2,3-dioxygenase